MGRYYWNKKDTVEDCRSVSISFLKKHDYFCGFKSGSIVWRNNYGEETSSISVTVSTLNDEKYIQFYYIITKRNTGEKIECDYKVQLVTTSCHFGGVRYWFICPLSKNGLNCGRRIGVLYQPPGKNYYGCRHCYNLSYESRNEMRIGRPGGIGYSIVLERKREELYPKIKRWTWRGRPTRKARKYKQLEQSPKEILAAYNALKI